jgi:hypothetical protein
LFDKPVDYFNLCWSQPKLFPVCLEGVALQMLHRILDAMRLHPIATGRHFPDALNQQLRCRALEQDTSRSQLFTALTISAASISAADRMVLVLGDRSVQITQGVQAAPRGETVSLSHGGIPGEGGRATPATQRE